MLKILIAEDEPAILNLIQINLTDEGYACSTAADGAIAADLMEQQTFDLALLPIGAELSFDGRYISYQDANCEGVRYDTIENTQV